MERINASPTFTDMGLIDLGGPRTTAFLERCARHIPFARLAEPLADLFADGDRSRGGAPHWSVVTMVKILFLQKVFGLSDPMTEEMLQDRISFRRFVGLSFDDKTPDHSTLSVFRRRLQDRGHGALLFEQSVQILEQQGLVLHTGTLIDATILPAPLGGDSSTADPCATNTVKGGRPYHGYRAHIATDRRGIITDYVYDTASVSEHQHFDQLARQEPQLVLADSGCRSQARIAEYQARGVVAAFCHRRVRGQKELTAQQKLVNRLIAPLRAYVEHPFAWIKPRLNNGKVRYRGVARNALDFALSAMAYNLCRSLSLNPVAAVHAA